MPEINETLFSVEDLKAMGFFKKDGRPSENMTDELWQKIFAQLKEKNIPFINGEKMCMKFKYNRAVINEYGEYLPDKTTAWQRYCMFINSALRDIRVGKKAYCYYLTQIQNLLRFHPNLQSRFIDYYWEVWLEKKE